jgi:hypothetical protein
VAWLTVTVTPRGSWDVPLPRLGVAFTLAGEDAELEWSGLGPGEAYQADGTPGSATVQFSGRPGPVSTGAGISWWPAGSGYHAPFGLNKSGITAGGGGTAAGLPVLPRSR